MRRLAARVMLLGGSSVETQNLHRNVMSRLVAVHHPPGGFWKFLETRDSTK